MIEIKVLRNVILNNIDPHDQLFRCIAPPNFFFHIKKVHSFYKSDADISDLIIECFGRDKSSQKLYFIQFISI